MPTGVFKCGACGEQLEEVTGFPGRGKMETPSCPTCNETTVERVYTAFFAKTSRRSRGRARGQA